MVATIKTSVWINPADGSTRYYLNNTDVWDAMPAQDARLPLQDG